MQPAVAHHRATFLVSKCSISFKMTATFDKLIYIKYFIHECKLLKFIPEMQIDCAQYPDLDLSLGIPLYYSNLSDSIGSCRIIVVCHM